MLRVGIVLLFFVLSGCVGNGNSTTTTTSANLSTATTSSSAPLFTYSMYTSSQFGSRLPSFKVTSTNSDIGFYQYGVGNTNYSTLIPIGQTIAIDPSLLTDGAVSKIYIRGVHVDKVTNENPIIIPMLTDLSPFVADGSYVGDRSMISYGPNRLNDVRRIAYNGTRDNNNIPDAKLTLFESDDLPNLGFTGTSRDLSVTAFSAISASLTNGSPSVVEISFGQDFDAIRAVGGYKTDGTGGFFDRMILTYSGTDPLLGQIPVAPANAVASAVASDFRLYKVKKDVNSTIGLLNAAGTLQNLVANPSTNSVVSSLYGVYLTMQTFDNYKYVGHLRLVDSAKNVVYSYKAIGRAGSLDGSPNGILFNIADNGRFHGYLTYDSNFKINQMTIYSDDIITPVSVYTSGATSGATASPALSSYQTASKGLSIQMRQTFNLWP